MPALRLLAWERVG